MGCPSIQESLIIIFVVALILGATRLPQIGDALGRAIRNFKRGIKGENEIDITGESKKIDSGNDDERQG